MTNQEKPKTKILSSVIWSFASRWSSKAIGMINIIVLARLLSPEDFGIVAMATIFLGVLESMTQVGIHLYVMRQEEDDIRVFNTGWTVGLIQALIISLILALSAPFIADFYSQQVLVDIIYCLAVIRIIKGLQSFGIYIAQKQLKFHIDFKVTFYSRLAYLAATVAFALWLENYWAIVWGQLVSAIFSVIISYALHPYRPKFQLYQWREMFIFSKSTLPMSIGRFINNQLDVAIIGRVAPTEFLGQYHVAANIGALFTKQLLAPLIKGLIPNLTRLKQEDNFQQLLRLTISFAIYLFLPIGFGLAFLAEEVVLVLLGEKWLLAIPILAWISIYTMLTGMMMFISEQFLIILNQEKLSNILMWIRNLILIIAIGLTLYFSSYHQLPKALVGAAFLSLPLVIFSVCYRLKMSVGYLISPWWPAMFSTGIMIFTLVNVSLPTLPIFLILIIKIIIAILSYCTVIAFLYVIRGKPEGSPEHLILSKLGSRFASSHSSTN